MKIIDQSHEIISLPDNLLQVIEAAGRTCYKSEDKIGCTNPIEEFDTENTPDYCDKADFFCNNCPDHSSVKFTKMLLNRGHHAMIEFGDIIVRFVTNRGVTHELVRHRLCSFAQESTRYVRYDGGMEFIRPVWCSEKGFGIFNEGYDFQVLPEGPVLEWALACRDAELTYTELLNAGWRPEQAREVLPNSLKTEIVVKGNIREWRHIFQLRCSKKAHPQIRALMLPLLAELKQKLPVVFDDIYPGEK